MAKIKRQSSFRMHQSAKVLFPLFSAEGEKYWVPGWDYENVMDGNTDLHENYVFLTAGHHRSGAHGARHTAHGQGHHPRHDHHDLHGHHHSPHLDPPKTIWLVKKYEPENYLVQFYRVEPEDKVAIITVQCKLLKENLTEVEVAYEYIGLSKKGNDFVVHYTAEAHEEFISAWQKALVHYFEAKSE